MTPDDDVPVWVVPTLHWVLIAMMAASVGAIVAAVWW